MRNKMKLNREFYKAVDEKFPYGDLLKVIGLVEVAIEQISDKDIKFAFTALQSLIAFSHYNNPELFKHLAMKKSEIESYLTKRKEYMISLKDKNT